MSLSKELIRDAVCRRFEISPAELSDDANLFQEFVDSLNFLEFAKVVQQLAEKERLPFDLEHFLLSESYSINAILLYLEAKRS